LLDGFGGGVAKSISYSGGGGQRHRPPPSNLIRTVRTAVERRGDWWGTGRGGARYGQRGCGFGRAMLQFSYMEKRQQRQNHGSVPEGLMGADCKSAGFAYAGSNPARPNLK